MKPDFALILSLEGISFLRRLSRGWELVGETDLHPPALKRRLAELREKALEGRTEPLTTKLILPESQVLYTSIASPGRDEAARRAAIIKALDGMTPYPVEALAFDYESDGEMLHVAVVARETIDEAESFAVEHAFNPVSVVAHPKGGSFTGEPFFGETAAAAELLPKGTKVKRDVLPTQVTLKLTAPIVAGASKGGVDTPAGADAAAKANPATGVDERLQSQTAAPESTHAPAVEKAREAAEESADAALAAATSAPDSAAEEEAEDAAELALARALSEPLDEAAPVAPDTTDEVATEAYEEAQVAASTDAPIAKIAAPEAEDPQVASPPDDTPKNAPQAPVALTPPANPDEERAEALPATSTADSTPDTAPDVAPQSVLAAPDQDASAPDAADHAEADSTTSDDSASVSPAAVEKGDAARDAVPADEPAAEKTAEAETEAKPTTDTGTEAAMAAAEDTADPEPPKEIAGAASLSETPPEAAESSPRLGPARDRFGVTSGELPPMAPLSSIAKATASAKLQKVNPPPLAAAPERLRKVLARPRPMVATGADAADEDGLNGSTNVFGARRAERRGASPLTIVVLTAGLVAFIGAVALWSALFGSGGAPLPAEPTIIAALPEPDAPVTMVEPIAPAEPATPEAMATEPAVIAAPPETAPLPTATGDAAPEQAAPVVTAEPTEPALAPDVPQTAQTLTDEDMAVAYAATGIWSQPPQTPAEASEERLTVPIRGAIDTQVPDQPDPALRTAATALLDEAPAAPQAPPPPGVSYQFDSRGLIVPSPEGAPTPSGTIVYLGRPSLVPPGRGRAEAAVALAEPMEAPTLPGASSDALAAAVAGALADLPFVLPGTPDTPPRPRPAGLVAALAVAPEVAEPAAELPAVEAPNPLAEFRPRPRPVQEPPQALAPEPDGDATLIQPQTGTTGTATLEATGTTLEADPELAGFRPRARPFAAPSGETAVALATPDPGTAAAPDVTRAPPAGDPALAGFRPRPRFDTPTPETGAVAGATAALVPTSFPGASDLAVAVTPVPQARPRGFADRAAASAAAAAAAAAVSAATQAAAAQVAIAAPRTPEPEAEADDEPETTIATAPSGGQRLPTRASVAEQATVENAIRLNQVNLIGIYGSSSDRRALVRLPSGRYVKVEVGDRVDGGRVSAISDRELRLVKNGRNVVLRIAQGG